MDAVSDRPSGMRLPAPLCKFYIIDTITFPPVMNDFRSISIFEWSRLLLKLNHSWVILTPCRRCVWELSVGDLPFSVVDMNPTGWLVLRTFHCSMASPDTPHANSAKARSRRSHDRRVWFCQDRVKPQLQQEKTSEGWRVFFCLDRVYGLIQTKTSTSALSSGAQLAGVISINSYCIMDNAV